MRLLSLLIFFIPVIVLGQSPHGDLKGNDCIVCHSPDTWQVDSKTIKFDHSVTNFKLLGSHKTVDCSTCHTDLVFKGTKKECSDCHNSVHAGTLSDDCTSCHNTNSWLISNTNEMHRRSRFPLLGAHQTADCSSCHAGYENLQFQVLKTECFACHSNTFNSAQNPNHVASGFSKDCLVCHDANSKSWSGANFNHDFFPLVGGHRLPNCFSCHTNSSFTGLSKACYSCHQPDYEGTLNPNHVQANFPKECQTCHTINGWTPAEFNHNLTQFPLTGRHIQVQCSSCHTSGYSGTPTDCNSCHSADFNATQNPNHISTGFPRDCQTCHTTLGWTPAQFEHDAPYFPIYTGRHRNEWNNCNDCHTNPADFKSFSCINCHEHNKTDMDNEHRGVNGYVYDSRDCLRCHPNGEERHQKNDRIDKTGNKIDLDNLKLFTTRSFSKERTANG